MVRLQGRRLSSEKLEREAKIKREEADKLPVPAGGTTIKHRPPDATQRQTPAASPAIQVAIAQLQELGVTAEIYTESNEEHFFTIKRVNGQLSAHTSALPDYLQEIQARRAKGRYTLGEAAQLIATNASADAKSVLAKLLAAASGNTLPCYYLTRTERHVPTGPNSRRINENLHEAHWRELNSWLEKNEPHVFNECRFPDPEATQPDAPAPTVADETGLTRREKQIRQIEASADFLGLPRLKIPRGGKKNIGERCLEQKQLFTESGFTEAWKAAVSKGRIRTEQHDTYAHRE